MSESAIIVPVAPAEPLVGDLRDRLDPSAALGVPAHITLLHPFMAPERIDASVVARIEAVADGFAAFGFRLATIGRFPGTLYLAPEPAAPFVALTRALWREFPEHPPYRGLHPEVVPHLTVAHAPDSSSEAAPEAALATLEARLPRPDGIAARCDRIVLIENASGRWRTMHTFALAAARNALPPTAVAAIVQTATGNEECSMSSKQCRIVGVVSYREGDGQEIVIPPGPCEVTVTALDVTISWSEGDSRGSAALPLAEYTRYVTTGCIVPGG